MDNEILRQALTIIFKTFRNPKFPLRLEGGTNLYVQGACPIPNDIDIVTDKEGYENFKASFNQFLVAEKKDEEKQTYVALYYIKSCPVEVLLYTNHELSMFDKIQTTSWNNLHLPIIPLKYARILYDRINNKDKVALIDQYYKDHPFF